MTDWERLARPSLRGLARYDPGPTRDELRARHGLADLEPLNWNEDLFGPPQEALDAAAEELARASLYPERAFADFRDAVAGRLGVRPESIVTAHGAQALIGCIATVFVERGICVVAPRLTYGLYGQVSAARGADVVRVEPAGLAIDLEAMAETARERRARLVWVCDPNNPTGALIERERWSRFLELLPPDCVVVVDEAYMDFAEPDLRADRARDVADGRPVIVVRSFSKIFGLAGLRLGYALCDPRAARLLDVVQEPFNVNRVALAAGRAALRVPGFVERRRAEVAAARELLADELRPAGVAGFPSHANFLLADLGVDDTAVCDAALRRGLLVRGGQEFGLPGHLRITVAPEPVMRRAAGVITDVVRGLR
jgi:histidinol-phosphate aminotransferase